MQVPEFRLYKAKQKEVDHLMNEHGECFTITRTYAKMILLTNPRSRAIISTREPNLTFDKMFVCFDAQKVGF